MSTKTVLLTACVIGIGVLASSWFLPSLMKPPSRVEIDRTLALQELRDLYRHLVEFRGTHDGKLPESIRELQKATHYLDGLTDEAYKRRIAALTYPFEDSVAPSNGKALAAYRAVDGQLFVLLDGGAVTNRPFLK